MESLADDYDCSKSSVWRSIHWVEDVLSADGRFQLPCKKALQNNETQTDDSPMDTLKTAAIDVTEHRIERPKKSRKTITPARKSVIRYYAYQGRKSLRTLKHD